MKNNDYLRISNSTIENTLKSYLNNKLEIEPDFFGSPSMLDFVKDMEFCQQLDINIKNKPRTHIKAEILSKITGEPINTMSNFFNSNSKMAIQECINKLKEFGLTPTNQLEVNKALIINCLTALKTQ